MSVQFLKIKSHIILNTFFAILRLEFCRHKYVGLLPQKLHELIKQLIPAIIIIIIIIIIKNFYSLMSYKRGVLKALQEAT